MTIKAVTVFDDHLPDWLDELTPAQRWAWVAMCRFCVQKCWSIGSISVKRFKKASDLDPNDIDAMISAAFAHGWVQLSIVPDPDMIVLVHLLGADTKDQRHNRRWLGVAGAYSNIADVRAIAERLPRGHEPGAVQAIKTALEIITQARPGCDGREVLEWLMDHSPPCGTIENPVSYMQRLTDQVVDNPLLFEKRLRLRK